MKAKDLYPEAIEEFLCLWDYQPILDLFGNIVFQFNDSDYQGDSFLLYRKDEKYGILIFGWGSCSGCDALQACTSFEDVDDLINELKDSIAWFSNKEMLCEYVKNKDWEAEYYYRSYAGKDFLKALLNFCNGVKL